MELCSVVYTRRPRVVPIDTDTARRIRQVASRRHTCGIRLMAAQLAGETGMPTSRKKRQQIY